jgi:hypothetical protein
MSSSSNPRAQLRTPEGHRLPTSHRVIRRPLPIEVQIDAAEEDSIHRHGNNGNGGVPDDDAVGWKVRASAPCGETSEALLELASRLERTRIRDEARVSSPAVSTRGVINADSSTSLPSTTPKRNHPLSPPRRVPEPQLHTPLISTSRVPVDEPATANPFEAVPWKRCVVESVSSAFRPVNQGQQRTRIDQITKILECRVVDSAQAELFIDKGTDPAVKPLGTIRCILKGEWASLVLAAGKS